MYRVHVDPRDDELFSYLQWRPARLFQKPYIGYLLFLAGDPDEEILDWLEQNAPAINSLTGNDVAFAIFSRRGIEDEGIIPLSLRSPPLKADHWSDWPPDDIAGRVERLPGHPAVELLYNSPVDTFKLEGNALRLMTYGSDDVAKVLGVLQDLPCLVVLDAVPNSMRVIRITQESIKGVIPLLRDVIGALYQNQEYHEYMGCVEKLVVLQNEVFSLERRVQELQNRLAACSAPLSESPEIQAVRKGTEMLSRPNWRRFSQAVGLLKDVDVQAVSTAVHLSWKHYPSLHRLKHNQTTPHQLIAYPKRLERCIDAILAALPPYQQIVEHVVSQRTLLKKELDPEIATTTKLLTEVKASFDSQLRLYTAYTRRIGLSRIIDQCARRAKINVRSSQLQTRFISFFGQIFKPETLIKLWDLLRISA